MTGEEALAAYGYVRGDGDRFIRPGVRTQQWKKVDGGWLRFEADGAPMPYCVASDSQATGLDVRNAEHHDAFEWIWPDEQIAMTYGNAARRAAAGWE